MADSKMIFVAGASSIAGAIITAVGHALGLTRRVKILESSVSKIKKRDADFVTMPQCDDKIKQTEKIVNLQFDRHTAEIADLKRAQENGFKAVFEKLDKIIENWRMAK